MNQHKRKYEQKEDKLNLHQIAIKTDIEAIEQIIKQNNAEQEQESDYDFKNDYFKMLWGKK